MAASLRPAEAKTAADPALLTTTLTPFGSERAGNADGSVPAWTGGMASAPLPPDQDVNIQIFTDEKPLYTVSSSNMAQYQDMISPGTQALMQKGMTLNVFQTHRTMAAPQYVLDNIAKNVTRAKLDPRGGRLGFSGAFGGKPFPIIDTSDPYVAGAQLIWNHLVSWPGAYSIVEKFSPGFVVANDRMILTNAAKNTYLYPYYDPNGSPETFDGYFLKIHPYNLAPAAAMGQEYVIWQSTNVLEKPDITWGLVNGQGRVRKEPDEAYDTPNSETNGITNLDDATGFLGSPQRYDWNLIGKKEMLIPYNNNAMHFAQAQDLVQPGFPNPTFIRWEKHRVWMVEATLHPGERNVTARRVIWCDEDTGAITLADCYDSDGDLYKTIATFNRVIPSAPGVIAGAYVAVNLRSGDYTYTGGISTGDRTDPEYYTQQAPGVFDPQQMAASAAF